MALKKTKNYKGIDCYYWRINNFNYDDINDKATVELYLYQNEQTVKDLSNSLLKELVCLDHPTVEVCS